MINIKRNNIRGLLISPLFIIIGLSFLSFYHIEYYFTEKQDEELVEQFFQEKKNLNTINDNTKEEQLLGILEIPKINLKKGFYNLNSKQNTVEKGLQLIKFEQSNIIIASHSGNSKISYFKNLNQLRKDDYIFVFSNRKKYVYLVQIINEIEKNGTIPVYHDSSNSYITLTTCSTTNKDKQLIIIGLLQSEQKY